MNFIALLVLICFHCSVLTSAENLSQDGIIPEDQSSSTSELSEDQIFIDDTLRLIQAGDAEIILDDDTKDIVLAIGLTGAGKTTMTKFIAIPEMLEAYDTGSNFLIRDMNRTISENATVISKTIFPELLIDPSTNHRYYDMPGFSDTRNTSIEIANAWFMKKVANHASSVKILFVVSQSTLQFGEHRDIFLKLLTHATEYIKEPKKFADAISLVVSKVKVRRNTEVEDVIEEIANFLLGVKDDLGEVTTDPEKQRTASDLIDAFLSKDPHGNYTKISFFKQPKQVGPLKAIPSVMEQWSHIKQVVENNTVFVNSSPEDFGISVSPGGQLLSLNLTRITNDKITSVILSIQEKIQSHYTAAINISLTDVGSVVKSFKKLEKIVEVLQHLFSRNEFLSQLTLSLADLNLSVISNDSIELQNLGSNLQFFEDVTGQQLPFNSKEWIRPIKIAIQTIKNKVDQKLTEVNSQVTQRISELSTWFQNAFTEKLNNPVDLPELNEEMRDFSQALQNFSENVVQKIESFNEFSSHLETFLHPYGKSFEMMLTEDVEIEGQNCKHISPLKLQHWLLPLEALGKHIRSKIQALEIQIHRKKLQQEIDTVTIEMANLENNATEQFNNFRLVRANLQLQAENDREVRNAKQLQQEDNCKTKATSMLDIHTQKLQQMREAQDQLKSSYQLEISQEKQKAETIQTTCQERIESLNGKIRQEREDHTANLLEIQRTAEEQDDRARQFHQESLNHENETCTKNLQNQEQLCSQQLALLNGTAEQVKSAWEEKIKEADSACQKRMETEKNSCTLQKTSTENLWKKESQRLTEALEGKETACMDDQRMMKINCDNQAARILGKIGKVKEDFQEQLTSEKESCERRKKSNNDLYRAELNGLEEEVVTTIKKINSTCDQNLVKAQSGDNYAFELKNYKTMAEDSERDSA